MGLMPCKECAKEISHTAQVCPHCGTSMPALTMDQKAHISQVGTWISIVAFFAFLITMISIFKR